MMFRLWQCLVPVPVPDKSLSTVTLWSRATQRVKILVLCMIFAKDFMIFAKDLTNVVFKSYLKHGSPTFQTCVSKVHAVRLPMHLVRWKHSCTTAQCLTLILSERCHQKTDFRGRFKLQMYISKSPRLCTRANAFAQTITPPQSLSRKVESARSKSFGCYTCGKLTIRNQRDELIIETTAALQKRFWAE